MGRNRAGLIRKTKGKRLSFVIGVSVYSDILVPTYPEETSKQRYRLVSSFRQGKKEREEEGDREGGGEDGREGGGEKGRKEKGRQKEKEGGREEGSEGRKEVLNDIWSSTRFVFPY